MTVGRASRRRNLAALALGVGVGLWLLGRGSRDAGLAPAEGAREEMRVARPAVLRPGEGGSVGEPAPLTAGDSRAEETKAIESAEEPRVRVHLSLPDGTSPERASVEVEGGGEALEWTREQRSLALGEGTRTLAVRGGRFGEWAFDGDVDVDPAAGSLELRLRPRRVIVAHVVAPAGEPARDVVVRARAVDEAADWEHGGFGHEETVSLGAPHHGWCAFGRDHELEAGDYEVAAAPWRHGPFRVRERVSVREGPVVVALRLAAVDPSEGVVLRVQDPDGEPLTPTEIYVEVWDATGSGGSGGAAHVPRDDGTIWVPTLLPRFSGQDPVEVVLRIHARAFGTTRVAVPARQAPPVVVRFEHPAHLRLRVPDPPGWLEGRARATLHYPRYRGGSWGAASAVFGDDGVAHFPAVQPGEYEVGLGNDWRGWQVHTDVGVVSALPGSREVALRLPAFHGFRVRGAGGHLLVMNRDGMRRAWRAGHLATSEPVEVPALPAGSYVVRSGGRSASVDLPTSSDVVLADSPR